MREFLSEPLEPLGAGDPRAMARGEPGLPRGFARRGEERRVVEVLAAGRTTGKCSGEVYVRRHTFRLRMDDGSVWEVYVTRQPPIRWYLKTREA